MQIVSAVVSTRALPAIRESLNHLGVCSVTSWPVEVPTREPIQQKYRWQPIDVTIVQATRMDVLVPLGEADRVMRAIAACAYSGEGNDGYIWVSDAPRARQITELVNHEVGAPSEGGSLTSFDTVPEEWVNEHRAVGLVEWATPLRVSAANSRASWWPWHRGPLR